jgi:NTP pyrophosphatase (non-canonical NTP hydrolase)
MLVEKILFGNEKTKKNYTFYLDRKINEKLEFLSAKSGLTKGKVISNLVEMFGDVYVDVIDLVDKYDGDSGLTLDDFLRENGYGFLVDGKCK